MAARMRNAIGIDILRLPPPQVRDDREASSKVGAHLPLRLPPWRIKTAITSGAKREGKRIEQKIDLPAPVRRSKW